MADAIAKLAIQIAADAQPAVSGFARVQSAVGDLAGGISNVSNQASILTNAIAGFNTGGFAAKVQSLFAPAASIVSNLASGNWLGAFTSTVGLAVNFVEQGRSAIKDALENEDLDEATAERAQAMFDTFDEVSEAMGDAFKTIAISIGTALLPVFERVADWLSENQESVTTFAKGFGDVLQVAVTTFVELARMGATLVEELWASQTALQAMLGSGELFSSIVEYITNPEKWRELATSIGLTLVEVAETVSTQALVMARNINTLVRYVSLLGDATNPARLAFRLAGADIGGFEEAERSIADGLLAITRTAEQARTTLRNLFTEFDDMDMGDPPIDETWLETAVATAEELIERWNGMLRPVREMTREQQIQSLFQMGLNGELLDQLQTMGALLEFNERMVRTTNEATRAFERARDPVEKLAETFANLTDALDAGFINEEEFAAGLIDQFQQLERQIRAIQDRGVEAITAGSTEAQRLIAANNRTESNDPQVRVERVLQQMRDRQARQIEQNEQIIEALRNSPALVGAN